LKPARTPPRLRRAYFDCRYGQLHVHNAIPAGGGFDELTTLVCIPATGQNGRAFGPVLAGLGVDRSVYAIDLPGSGESDPAPGVAAVDAGVAAVTDFLDSMRIRKVDMLALGDGEAVAAGFAALRAPQLRKLAVAGATAGAGLSSHPCLRLPEAPADVLPQLLAFFA
jgi:pimeloyl-ACP methyl ester carboxylesterase